MNLLSPDPADIYRKRAAMPGFCHFNEVSAAFILFLIFLEDMSFSVHRGYKIKAMKQAFAGYLRKDGTPGGSTITQQLVKNLFFTFEPDIIRKIRETVLAVRFEKRLSKQEILELYINIIYFDNGQYGIHDAAFFYFNKSPKKLTVNQAFFLACMLPVVGVYNPLYHAEEFVRYRNDKLAWLVFLDDDIKNEILRHGPELLDEELIRSLSPSTDRYNAPGPLINEKYGIFGTDPLI